MKIKYDREHQVATLYSTYQLLTATTCLQKIVKLEKQLSELQANPSIAVELTTTSDANQQVNVRNHLHDLSVVGTVVHTTYYVIILAIET